MAYEQDNDRIAGELLNLLKGSLARPASGSGINRPQAAADDSTMLNMIKQVLGQTMPPGMRPREQAGKPSAQAGAPLAQPSDTAPDIPVGGWEGLFRRQAQERTAMHERHERERSEMHQRHVQEMESAMGGAGAAYSPAPRRATPTVNPTQVTAARRRLSGTEGL